VTPGSQGTVLTILRDMLRKKAKKEKIPVAHVLHKFLNNGYAISFLGALFGIKAYSATGRPSPGQQAQETGEFSYGGGPTAGPRDLAAALGPALPAMDGEEVMTFPYGDWGRVLISTYSEFGRRAKENGSQGTDHGTAAPHLMMGGQVKGGFAGSQPDLGQLEKNDLIYSTDYRRLRQEIYLQPQVSGVESQKYAGSPPDDEAKHGCRKYPDGTASCNVD